MANTYMKSHMLLWECYSGITTWENCLTISIKVGIFSELAVSLPGICSKEMCAPKDMYKHNYLYKLEPNWKQPKC